MAPITLKSVFFGIILLVASKLLAQETDTTEVKKFHFPEELGLYAFSDYSLAPSSFDYLGQLTLGAEFQYKTFRLGGYYARLAYPIERLVVFPATMEFDYQHHGWYAGYQMIDSKWLQGALNIAWAAGEITWTNLATDALRYRSPTDLIEPKLQLDFLPLAFLKVYVSAGYRWMFFEDLPMVDQEGFEGFTCSFGLKLGYHGKE